MNIVVVGSINMDILIPVGPYPSSGETVTSCAPARYIPGGKGANQAVAAARQGAQVTMLGMVGSDAYGQILINSLRNENVDTAFIGTDAGPSGTAFVHVEKNGNNRIILSPGANECLTPDRILRHKQLITQADAVLLQMEIPIDTVRAVLEIADRASVPTFLDPSPAREDLYEVLTTVDWIAPNQMEAEMITGQRIFDTKTAHLAGAKLQQLGARRVLLKVGPQGAYLIDGNGIIHHPGFPVNPIDTTAAGDAFSAAFVVDYLGSNDAYHALGVACASGGLTTLTQGAQPALPTRQEVLDFIRGQRESTK